MTTATNATCPFPGCAAAIHPEELACGPCWHPLTAAEKESWYAAQCAYLSGRIDARERDAARERIVGRAGR